MEIGLLELLEEAGSGFKRKVVESRTVTTRPASHFLVRLKCVEFTDIIPPSYAAYD
jgi:hypothetical protein